MANESQIFLVSGVPGAGKSHFCRWLADRHGFHHIDVKLQPRYGPFDRAVSHTFQTARCDSLRALMPKDRPAVVDWGFPVECIPIVETMKKGRFRLWWFDAPREHARDAFLLGGREKAVSEFDLQWRKIEGAQATIAALFAPNIITTVEADGTRMEPEAIADRMGIIS